MDKNKKDESLLNEYFCRIARLNEPMHDFLESALKKYENLNDEREIEIYNTLSLIEGLFGAYVRRVHDYNEMIHEHLHGEIYQDIIRA